MIKSCFSLAFFFSKDLLVFRANTEKCYWSSLVLGLKKTGKRMTSCTRFFLSKRSCFKYWLHCSTSLFCSHCSCLIHQNVLSMLLQDKYIFVIFTSLEADISQMSLCNWMLRRVETNFKSRVTYSCTTWKIEKVGIESNVIRNTWTIVTSDWLDCKSCQVFQLQ